MFAKHAKAFGTYLIEIWPITILSIIVLAGIATHLLATKP